MFSKKMFLIVQDKDKMFVEGGGVIHALVYTVRWTLSFITQTSELKLEK